MGTKTINDLISLCKARLHGVWDVRVAGVSTFTLVYHVGASKKEKTGTLDGLINFVYANWEKAQFKD